jgi:hypothetical protein
MTEALCHAIRARYAGARTELVEDQVRAEVVLDGTWYRARLDMAPLARVAVGLPCTDGFELTLKWSDRWTHDRSPRAASFDDSFLVETNDLALAGVWLDHEARAALLASRYVSGQHATRQTAPLFRDGSWIHEVSNDEVCARRREPEPSIDRMADLLKACLFLAGYPERWARTFAAIGQAIGGEPATRIEIGGKPALRIHRSSLDVFVHLVRRLGPGDPGRLRTVISAHRHGSGGETLSLVGGELPRSPRPPAVETPTGTLAIDARAAQLLEVSRPSATTVRAHDVELAFEGAMTDHVRLGAGIDLAAWWASNAFRTGPYR